MHKSVKTWSLRFVKLAIAVIGLWWVLTHTPWNDQATILAGKEINAVKFLDATPVSVIEPQPDLPATAIAVKFRSTPARVLVDGREQTLRVTDPPISFEAVKVIAKEDLAPVEGTGEPAIQIGLRNLVRNANKWLLLAAWAVLIIPFIVTAWRWKELMLPQGIKLPLFQMSGAHIRRAVLFHISAGHYRGRSGEDHLHQPRDRFQDQKHGDGFAGSRHWPYSAYGYCRHVGRSAGRQQHHHAQRRPAHRRLSPGSGRFNARVLFPPPAPAHRAAMDFEPRIHAGFHPQGR